MRSEDIRTPTRIRGIEIRPLPTDRRLAIGAERTGRATTSNGTSRARHVALPS